MQAVRRPVALDPEKLALVREASNREIVKSARRIKGDTAKFDPRYRGPSAKHVVSATERISHSQVFSVNRYSAAVDPRWDLPPAPKRLIRITVRKTGVTFSA